MYLLSEKIEVSEARVKISQEDVTGQRFAMLTALYPTEERSRYGSVMWHCRCDCENEIDVPLKRLRYSGQISCGCMADKRYKEVHEKQTQIAGTSIDIIRSEKLRADRHFTFASYKFSNS